MTSMNVDQPETEPALWATQGGGLARLAAGDIYVWHEVPDWMQELPDGDADKAAIGDRVHPEWGLAPANDAAQEVMNEDGEL